jgi:5-methylcytosine-specific restriction endonuclease McrA
MPIESTCRTCGKAIRVRPFRYRADRGNFCSAACRAETQRVPRHERICRACGAPFVIRDWQAVKGEGQYCSAACRTGHARQSRRDPSKRTTQPCLTCGEPVTYWMSRPHPYCSSVCAGRGNVGNINGWAASAFIAVCEQCGRSYQTTPKATRGRFCSRRCYGVWLGAGNALTGKDSPTWRGGHEPYYGPSWRPARRQARARDGVCQDCGTTHEQVGRALDVHHIVPFKRFGVERHAEANDLPNLVTLCPPCHIRREWSTNWRA